MEKIKQQYPIDEVGHQVFEFVFSNQDFFSKVFNHKHYESFGNYHSRFNIVLYKNQYKELTGKNVTVDQEMALTIFSKGCSQTMAEVLKQSTTTEKDNENFYKVMKEEQPEFLKRAIEQ